SRGGPGRTQSAAGRLHEFDFGRDLSSHRCRRAAARAVARGTAGADPRASPRRRGDRRARPRSGGAADAAASARLCRRRCAAQGQKEMRVRRSTILVPGNVDRMIEKARHFAADVVLLDLEDAVPAADADKDKARRNVIAALGQGTFRAREVAVRINGPRTRWFGTDVAALAAAGAKSLILPHTYGAEDVARAEITIAETNAATPEITLAVETPATLLALEEIARQARFITALAVAPVDFTLALGSTALLGGTGGIASGDQL